MLITSKVAQHRPRCASAYSLELVERRRMSQSVQTFVRREDAPALPFFIKYYTIHSLNLVIC